MRTIGKIAALAMTLSLAFVLTACGGSPSSSAAVSSASASGSASSEAVSGASASASSASASSESSADAETADVYNNEFFGIQFALPAGWSFADPDAVGNVNQMIAAVSGGSTFDMVALNETQSQIVIVGIEVPSDATANMTAEDYLEALEEQIKANMGGTYAFTTTSATITFDGIDRELPASITNTDLEGTNLCIGLAVTEKEGAFFSVIVMAETEDEVTSAFESFSAATA